MKVTDYFSKKATIVSFIMSIFVIYIHANNLSYYGIAAKRCQKPEPCHRNAMAAVGDAGAGCRPPQWVDPAGGL